MQGSVRGGVGFRSAIWNKLLTIPGRVSIWCQLWARVSGDSFPRVYTPRHTRPQLHTQLWARVSGCVVGIKMAVRVVVFFCGVHLFG